MIYKFFPSLKTKQTNLPPPPEENKTSKPKIQQNAWLREVWSYKWYEIELSTYWLFCSALYDLQIIWYNGNSLGTWWSSSFCCMLHDPPSFQNISRPWLNTLQTPVIFSPHNIPARKERVIAWFTCGKIRLNNWLWVKGKPVAKLWLAPRYPESQPSASTTSQVSCWQTFLGIKPTFLECIPCRNAIKYVLGYF